MEPETLGKFAKLAVKRGNVVISSTPRAPVIYTASEDVTWSTGSARINGIGTSRAVCLAALDDSFARLTAVLEVAE